MEVFFSCRSSFTPVKTNWVEEGSFFCRIFMWAVDVVETWISSKIFYFLFLQKFLRRKFSICIEYEMNDIKIYIHLMRNIVALKKLTYLFRYMRIFLHWKISISKRCFFFLYPYVDQWLMREQWIAVDFAFLEAHYAAWNWQMVAVVDLTMGNYSALCFARLEVVKPRISFFKTIIHALFICFPQIFNETTRGKC